MEEAETRASGKTEVGQRGSRLEDASGAKGLGLAVALPNMLRASDLSRIKFKRVALASSAADAEVKKYEKIARVQDLIEKSTSADDADESKPSPDIFHAALKLLGNPRRDSVLVVGDSPFDAIAAKKAKIAFVGVLCGGFSKRILRAKGCRDVYEDPADLLKHLDEVLNVSGFSKPFLPCKQSELTRPRNLC